jgi:hypothetical protein
LSKFIPLRLAKLGQTEVPDGSAILRGRTEEPNKGSDGTRWRARRRARRGQMGWWTEGLFTFKRKNDMFYIYVI